MRATGSVMAKISSCSSLEIVRRARRRESGHGGHSDGAQSDVVRVGAAVRGR